MPSARHAAGRGSSSRHARRKASRLLRVGTPLFGATLVAGAAFATVGAGSGPGSPSAGSADVSTDTGEIPAVGDLRELSLDDTARDAERDAPDVPEAEPSPAATAAPTPVESPAPSPTTTPNRLVTPTTTPTPEVAAIPPVPGCDATVPDEGDIANGRLGDDHLCDIGSGHELRPDAAAAFLALDAAYQADTGDGLLECVTDSYRSYDEQVELKARKPYLAAQPGTSNHGWGLALDLACGADSYGSDVYAWLDDNGDELGWGNPDWARAGGSKPEPWHWEFDSDLLG